METRPIASPRKTAQQIGAEWDAAAVRRHEQIQSRRDVSFWHVLSPAALDLLDGCNRRRLLDMGCGTGELTKQFATNAEQVLGIDVSARSVAIAQQHVRPAANVSFTTGPLEQVLPNMRAEPFTTAAAAMTLMTIPDLSATLRAVANALVLGGHLVATLTHPCFWPGYWGYDSAAWFSYDQEIFIEAPFRISLDKTDLVTTHIHRPLAMYLTTAAEVGFHLEVFHELMPTGQVAQLYPQPWKAPRFAALRWRRTA